MVLRGEAMTTFDKHARTNFRAMQVPPYRGIGVPPAWNKPGDCNVTHLTMGSWRAKASKMGVKK